MTPSYLTVEQAALRACVGRSTLRTWLRDGLLPHLRVGARGRRGKLLIDPADLDALMASFKVGGRPPAPPPAPAAKPASSFGHLRLT